VIVLDEAGGGFGELLPVDGEGVEFPVTDGGEGVGFGELFESSFYFCFRKGK